MTAWFCGSRTRGHWWFRVKGYGLHWKDARRAFVLLSERERLGPWWQRINVGPFWFGVLRPNR